MSPERVSFPTGMGPLHTGGQKMERVHALMQ